MGWVTDINHAGYLPDPSEERAAWLAWRRQGIGASDVAAIIGISPWSTPFNVWADKMGALEDEQSEAMAWGLRLENLILDAYEEEHEVDVVNRQARVSRGGDGERWMRATIDGDAGDRLVEAKADSSFGWDDVPLHYQAQAQWQMLVTGHTRVDFAVLHQGRRFAVYTVEADPEAQEAIFKACERFWFDHVVAQVAPPVHADDVRTVAAVWPDHVEAEVEVDADVVRRLAEVKAEIRALEHSRDALQAQLQAQLGESAVGTVAGEKWCTWKTQTATRIDTTRLKAERPDVAEEYAVESTSRVLRISIPKEST